MNPKSLKNLKPFDKGQSGHPIGRPMLAPEIRAARKANQAELIKLIQTYCSLTENQAMERLAGPKTLQIEAAVQGLINRAKEGDVPAFKYLVEIMCGKIPESDYDEFTEEDLAILRRIKEVKAKSDPEQID